MLPRQQGRQSSRSSGAEARHATNTGGNDDEGSGPGRASALHEYTGCSISGGSSGHLVDTSSSGSRSSYSMSDSSSSSGDRSGDSTKGDSETDGTRGCVESSHSESRNTHVSDGTRTRCRISDVPDPLLASILRCLPQTERIHAASLVCKQWLRLVRGRLCQSDTTVSVLPGLLAHLQQLPPGTLRVALRSLAVFSRHAKLMISLQEPLQPSRHGVASQFSVLRALLLELSDVRHINISVRCPIGARLLGATFAGVLQRSADTLVTLEIWGADLADATLAALLAATPSPWDHFSPQSGEVGEAFLSTAAALEASLGSHLLRRDGYRTSVRIAEGGTDTCRGMLTATAHVLRHRTETSSHHSSNPFSATAGSSRRLLCQQQQQPSGHSVSRSSDGAASLRSEGGTACSGLRREAAPGSGNHRGTLNRDSIRRRIADIENCCCCITAAETAFRLWRSFQHVRLRLPRLRTLAVASWRLLRVLHCPNMEELKLASNAPARMHSAGNRPQQPQQQECPQRPPAEREGTGGSSGSAEAVGTPASPGYTQSALQELLFFLLRSGSNLLQLHGYYSVEVVNEPLLQPVCAAAATLFGTSDAATGTANISAGVGTHTAGPSLTSMSQTRQRRTRGGFFAAAMAAVDAILAKPVGLQSSRPAPDAPQTHAAVHAGLPTSSRSSGGRPGLQLPAVSSAAAFGNFPVANENMSVWAVEAAQAAAAREAASPPLKSGDSILAAAAGLCASVGRGCRHRRHLPGGCCAAPCGWGTEGELLLVLLPRLRVVRTSDFLLLGLLLLPRLEELRQPEILDSLANNPTAGFALLWAYLGTYGRSLRVLETKGTAPPLAAFLGAGTTAEPLPSNIRPDEAAATKALQLLLRMHRSHPLLDPAGPFADESTTSNAALRAAATAAGAAAAGCGIPTTAARTVDSAGRRCTMPRQQHQHREQRPHRELNHGGQQSQCASEPPTAMEVETDMRNDAARGSQGSHATGGLAERAHQDAGGPGGTRRVLYGLKFGQLRRLQCHSSFLPYLAEPVPQCGALRHLNTEGDSDEVLWFVALLRNINRVCVRDPRLSLPRRRATIPDMPPYADGEESNDNRSRQRVTLEIRNYTGTALFFGPHVYCPNLRQLQVQRGDEDFDSFLVGGGAANLQVLRYQGQLFGGRGASAPRTLVASHEVRVLHGTEEREERVQQLLRLLDLPLSFSPLRLSPFASLRELHVWTLDAKTVVRLACAVAAATNPPLSRAWQVVLRRRKEEREVQLQRRQHSLLQRRQILREQESLRLLLRQRRLYEAYRARQRRLRRLCSAVTSESGRQGSPSRSPQGAPHPEGSEIRSRLSRELASMRQQLQQLQRRLEALATGSTRNAPSVSRRHEQQQLQRHQRFRQGLQRLRRLRSHHQRLVALRRLLQISVTDTAAYRLDAFGGGNELRRLDALEVERRRIREQRGREGDFGCSRTWCFWACHRAVSALSQLLPQLRVCVVQQLRGNASSLRLLLRGLPRLEMFAVEESPRTPHRQRLVQLATSLGFTIRRGPLVIPALRSNLVNWGSATISRQFRILSRSPAGGRAATTSIAAAELVVRELLDSSAQRPQGCPARPQRRGASTSDAAVSGATPQSLAGARSTAARSERSIGAMSAETSAVATSAAEPSAASNLPADQTTSASDTAHRLSAEGEVTRVGRGVSSTSASRADGEPRSSSRPSVRRLRCSVYNGKRWRDSSSKNPRAPMPKRRRRTPSSGAGGAAADARQDMQMARGLAEELEEQLTS